ncbi:MAG: hypothetical protein EBQ95_06150 [Gammaproteobacteria bacterium]|nr:hypothetical protein [Gammaproteobacteria bacterium]
MLNPSLDQSYSFDDLFIRRQEISALEQERLKLALIKKLFDEQRILDFKKNTDNTSNPTGLTEQGLYYFLVTFGLIEQCAGSFVFGASLFGLIPGLSKISLIAISLVYTFLDSLLFYAFEVTFLKEALGIESLNSEFKEMLKIYQEQLYYIELLNIHIEALKRNPNFNHTILDTLEKINQDIIEKCETMQDHPLSTISQCVKYGVLSFGVLANVAESYFLAHSFLILLTPTLAFTGMGYLLIAITIIANLGFFYAMGASSVVKIMNPEFDDLKALKKNFNNFNSVISASKTVRA